MIYFYDLIKKYVILLLFTNVIITLIPNERYEKIFKTISGLLIIVCILTPINEIFFRNYDYSEMSLNYIFEENEGLKNINEDIINVSINEYQEKLGEGIKKDLENKGFRLEYVHVFLEIDYENELTSIDKIEVKLDSSLDYNDSLNNATTEYIYKYLLENYYVDSGNIIVI